MIRVLSDMPVGVLGLEAIDDVEEQDYRDVLVPAVEAAIAEHGQGAPRLRPRPGSSTSNENEKRCGRTSNLVHATRHPSNALPSSPTHRWVGPAMRVFSILLPGRPRAFPLAQREAATQWASDWGHAPTNQRRDSLTGSSAWPRWALRVRERERAVPITARRSVDPHRLAGVDMYGQATPTCGVDARSRAASDPGSSTGRQSGLHLIRRMDRADATTRSSRQVPATADGGRRRLSPIGVCPS